MAAALVPSFASGLMFNWAADVVALVALLGAARALLALAGMDVGTSFGGIGSSREMMIATLAEPAMMLIVLTLAIAAGTTRLAGVADFFIAEPFAVRVSLALSLVALVIVALAENARIPVDNPVTHLELTMVHEAMVLEYSGRHLALIEAASHLKLVLYISLLICLFAPFGMAPASAGVTGWRSAWRRGRPSSCSAPRCSACGRSASPRCASSAFRTSSASPSCSASSPSCWRS